MCELCCSQSLQSMGVGVVLEFQTHFAVIFKIIVRPNVSNYCVRSIWNLLVYIRAPFPHVTIPTPYPHGQHTVQFNYGPASPACIVLWASSQVGEHSPHSCLHIALVVVVFSYSLGHTSSFQDWLVVTLQDSHHQISKMRSNCHATVFLLHTKAKLLTPGSHFND